jgi:oligosaccharide repeat unit polymerase
MIYKCLIFISLFLPFIIKFILWPSKKNIIFIQSIPFFLIAYTGGILFLFDEAIQKHSVSEENIFYLSVIMLIGSLFYTLSFLIAFKSKISIDRYIKSKIKKIYSIFNTSFNYYFYKLKLVITILSILAIILYIFSYKKMGFVPMFAENPFAAKYFAGEYQDKYRPVAHFFRSALNISTIVVPFLLLIIFTSKKILLKIFYGLIFLTLIVLTFLSLRRGPIAEPIIFLLLLFFVYYKNGKYALYFIVFYLIIFIVGAGFNELFFYFLGLKDNIDIISIVRGVPDISDLLWFWDSFMKTHYEFSYGRTIYGGLVPYHYDWNPSVLTKLVIGAGKNVATGGFRLPFQIEGYIAFGIMGTILWSIIFGFINGIYLKLIKTVISEIKDSFIKLYIAIFLINFIYTILNFTIKMQIDKLFFIVICSFIIFVLTKLRLKKVTFSKKLKRVFE